MNLIKLFPIVTVAATALFAFPAQAFRIDGEPVYAIDGLPTTLDVIKEGYSLGPESDPDFGVADPTKLKIGALDIDGTLVGGFTGSATYTAVKSYITGFQFLGKDAVFNINAGTGVIAGFVDDTNFTIDSDFTGDIVDLSGTLLGIGTGSFSADQKTGTPGDFSIRLEGEAIPSPALLPGLIGLGMGALRKRKRELAD